MSDYTNPTPRRPIVPGPSGIAAKAIAVRERIAQSKPGEAVKMSPEEFDEVRAIQNLPEAHRARSIPPLIPFQGVGNLAKGIAAVMAEVGTIQKTGYNKFHNYAYATLQDLLFAITPLMGRHGVVVIQNEVERTQVETRIMVTYEFSIFHTSGEVWPEKPRFTGMCIGRNSKGDYDDKAINKAHSAARKYFLLSLFQVPSGDFDDADEGPATSQQQSNPQKRAAAAEQPKANERPRTVPGPATQSKEPTVDERLPHKIGFTPGMTADQWAIAYIKVIEKANDTDEIAQWDGLNDNTLQRLSDKYPEVYEQVRMITERRMAQLGPREIDPEAEIMPDPAKDAQEAMQWVAQNLVDIDNYDGAEKFWNETVAPREKEFDPLDWELLLTEWRRAENRLAPDTNVD